MLKKIKENGLVCAGISAAFMIVAIVYVCDWNAAYGLLLAALIFSVLLKIEPLLEKFICKLIAVCNPTSNLVGGGFVKLCRKIRPELELGTLSRANTMLAPAVLIPWLIILASTGGWVLNLLLVLSAIAFCSYCFLKHIPAADEKEFDEKTVPFFIAWLFLSMCAALFSLAYLTTPHMSPAESKLISDVRAASKEIKDLALSKHQMPSDAEILKIFHNSQP